MSAGYNAGMFTPEAGMPLHAKTAEILDCITRHGPGRILESAYLARFPRPYVKSAFSIAQRRGLVRELYVSAGQSAVYERLRAELPQRIDWERPRRY